MAVKDESADREPKLSVAPEVRRVRVKDGDFTFLDQTGKLVASFAGVYFRTNIRSAQALRGDAKVARVSLRDRFFLDQLSSPLRYEPDVLELSKISARVAEGQVDGYFAIQPEAEDSPFTTSVNFHDVLADQLVENAGGTKGMVQGKLEGSFQASGKTSDPEALVGQGEIFLREGRVQQYRLLILLGQILQIEELQELHLEQADAKYHLSPGLVTIDELILRSPNIRLTSSVPLLLTERCDSIRSSRSTTGFAANFSKQFATTFTAPTIRSIQPSSFRSAALLSGRAQTW